jgi:hypothetical protein
VKSLKYALITIILLQIIQVSVCLWTLQKTQETLNEIKIDLKIIKITQSDIDSQKKAEELEILSEYGQELKDMKEVL